MLKYATLNRQQFILTIDYKRVIKKCATTGVQRKYNFPTSLTNPSNTDDPTLKAGVTKFQAVHLAKIIPPFSPPQKKYYKYWHLRLSQILVKAAAQHIIVSSHQQITPSITQYFPKKSVIRVLKNL
jgi:hypothetical protein